MRKKILSKHSCRAVTVWTASLLFGSFVGFASAQQNPPPERTQNPNPDVTQGEVVNLRTSTETSPTVFLTLVSYPNHIVFTTLLSLSACWRTSKEA
jgi:hypothetical protein